MSKNSILQDTPYDTKEGIRKVEGWLNGALTRALSSTANRNSSANLGIQHTKVDQLQLESNQKGTQLFGIDAASLAKFGLTINMIERIYRCLYVYSHGVHQLLSETANSSNNKTHILSLIWKVFVTLLEGFNDDHSMETLSSMLSATSTKILFNIQEEYEGKIMSIIDDKNLMYEQVSALETTISKLREEYSSIEASNDLLNHQVNLGITKYEMEVRKRLECELRLQELNHLLKNCLQELDISNNHISSYHQKLMECNLLIEHQDEEKDSLNKRLELQKNEIANLRMNVISRSHYSEELEKQYRAHLVTTESMKSELLHLNNQLSRVTSRNKELSHLNIEQENTLLKLQGQYENIRNERDALSSKEKALTAHIEVLMKENKTSLQEVGEKRKNEIIIHTELENTKRILKKTTENYLIADEALRNLRDDNEMVTTELESYRKKNSSLAERAVTAETSFQQLSGKYQDLKKHEEKLASLLDHATAECNELQSRVKSLGESVIEKENLLLKTTFELDGLKRDYRELESEKLNNERIWSGKLEMMEKMLGEEKEMRKKGNAVLVEKNREIVKLEASLREVKEEKLELERKEKSRKEREERETKSKKDEKEEKEEREWGKCLEKLGKELKERKVDLGWRVRMVERLVEECLDQWKIKVERYSMMYEDCRAAVDRGGVHTPIPECRANPYKGIGLLKRIRTLQSALAIEHQLMNLEKQQKNKSLSREKNNTFELRKFIISALPEIDIRRLVMRNQALEKDLDMINVLRRGNDIEIMRYFESQDAQTDETMAERWNSLPQRLDQEELKQELLRKIEANKQTEILRNRRARILNKEKHWLLKYPGLFRHVWRRSLAPAHPSNKSSNSDSSITESFETCGSLSPSQRSSEIGQGNITSSKTPRPYSLSVSKAGESNEIQLENDDSRGERSGEIIASEEGSTDSGKPPMSSLNTVGNEDISAIEESGGDIVRGGTEASITLNVVPKRRKLSILYSAFPTIMRFLLQLKQRQQDVSQSVISSGIITSAVNTSVYDLDCLLDDEDSEQCSSSFNNNNGTKEEGTGRENITMPDNEKQPPIDSMFQDIVENIESVSIDNLLASAHATEEILQDQVKEFADKEVQTTPTNQVTISDIHQLFQDNPLSPTRSLGPEISIPSLLTSHPSPTSKSSKVLLLTPQKAQVNLTENLEDGSERRTIQWKKMSESKRTSSVKLGKWELDIEDDQGILEKPNVKEKSPLRDNSVSRMFGTERSNGELSLRSRSPSNIFKEITDSGSYYEQLSVEPEELKYQSGKMSVKNLFGTSNSDENGEIFAPPANFLPPSPTKRRMRNRSTKLIASLGGSVDMFSEIKVSSIKIPSSDGFGDSFTGNTTFLRTPKMDDEDIMKIESESRSKKSYLLPRIVPSRKVMEAPVEPIMNEEDKREQSKGKKLDKRSKYENPEYWKAVIKKELNLKQN